MEKSDMSPTNIVIDTIENLGEQCSPRSFHDEHEKLERRFWTVVLMVMSYDDRHLEKYFEAILGQYYTLFYEYLDYQQKVLEKLNSQDIEVILTALEDELVKEKLSDFDHEKSNLIARLEQILSDLPSRQVPVTLKPQLNKPYQPELPNPEQVLNGLFDYFIHDYELSSYYWPYKKFPLQDSQDLRNTLKGLLFGYTLRNIKNFYEYSNYKGTYKEVESAAEAVRMAMIELPFEHLETAQFIALTQHVYRVNGMKPNKASLSKAITRAMQND